MTDRTSFYPELEKKIAPAQGKLAVLLPGLGAVSTTLIAGVHLIRKGLAKPFGSVTQMQKLRLGKRTQPRFKPVKELVPLTELSDLVFGGWDIFPDNTHEAAAKAGFKAVEFLFPYDYEAAEIRSRLDRFGLRQALFNLPPGDWDKGERGLSIFPERADEFALRAAEEDGREVGAGVLVRRLDPLRGDAAVGGHVGERAPVATDAERRLTRDVLVR